MGRTSMSEVRERAERTTRYNRNLDEKVWIEHSCGHEGYRNVGKVVRERGFTRQHVIEFFEDAPCQDCFIRDARKTSEDLLRLFYGRDFDTRLLPSFPTSPYSKDLRVWAEKGRKVRFEHAGQHRVYGPDDLAYANSAIDLFLKIDNPNFFVDCDKRKYTLQQAVQYAVEWIGEHGPWTPSDDSEDEYINPRSRRQKLSDPNWDD